MKSSPKLIAAALALACPAASLAAQEAAHERTPVVQVGDQVFYDEASYVNSAAFREQGLFCKLPSIEELRARGVARTSADCSFDNTNPAASYAPTFLYDIPVVVHILMNSSGSGVISDTQVQAAIDLLNDDFRAAAGSAGAGGVDTMIQFHLATSDPSGNPTTGITRTTNDSWFQDNGDYWNTLAWDTNRYMNIYTLNPGGAIGYVPDLPQGGIAGQNFDRVVMLWSAFGPNSPIGGSIGSGRVTSHEAGHYLGLFHTFTGGCGGPDCYTSGDRICDTGAESSPAQFGCTPRSTCSSPDPIENYMDYSAPTCWTGFTPEQARRMRCSLEFYRPNLAVTTQITALAVPRNGAGVNPVEFSSLNRPIVGANWDSTITSPVTPYGSILLFGLGGAIDGPTLGIGQLLCLPPYLDFTASGAHSIPLPNNAALLGATFATQGVIVAPGNVMLTNGIDLTLGNL